MRNAFKSQLTFFLAALISATSSTQFSRPRCGERDTHRLRYVRGDALTDDPWCIGPDGKPYPMDEINALLPTLDARHHLFSQPRRVGSHRQGRTMSDFDATDFDVAAVKNTLLKSVTGAADTPSIDEAFSEEFQHRRSKREGNKKYEDEEKDKMKGDKNDASCPQEQTTPSRLCRTTYNTTAPKYGVSLTNGKPVTIVQKFPDLLQQVVFETCTKSECDVVHGECVQTYVPYLFLVIPLGPVTLTGQDYVLVESGCTCRPKYAGSGDRPDPLSILPQF